MPSDTNKPNFGCIYYCFLLFIIWNLVLKVLGMVNKLDKVVFNLILFYSLLFFLELYLCAYTSSTKLVGRANYIINCKYATNPIKLPNSILTWSKERLNIEFITFLKFRVYIIILDIT